MACQPTQAAARCGAKVGAMKKVDFGVDRAVVTIMTEITEESMINLVSEIERLIFGYFYPRIELRISSPGGVLTALDYYLDAITRFRQYGVRIETRALTQAYSAAAAILSLGDAPRTAAGSTALRYHFHRVQSTQDLTAQKARELLRVLTYMDRKLTLRIAARAFQGYGPHGTARVEARPSDSGLDAFSEADWLIMNRLTGNRIAKDFGDKAKKSCLKALRTRVAKRCERRGDASGFYRLYDELFEIDATITPALAQELRLIDRLADDDAALAGVQAQPRDNAVTIPEWHPIFSPNGEIERADLCRHVIVFGETGSGKTQSAILPVLKAILHQANPSYAGTSPVSCAVVIDPKKELLPILNNGASRGVAVKVLDTGVKSKGGLQLNLMIGDWSIDKELAANDMLGAANKILKRCASFAPANSAFQAVLGRAAGDNAYWKGQGVRLAQTIIALLLVVLKHRAVIFDPKNLNELAPHVKTKLRAFGSIAGFMAPEAERAGDAYAEMARELDEIHKRIKLTRRAEKPARRAHERAAGAEERLVAVDHRKELRKAWKAYIDRLCGGPRKKPALRRMCRTLGKEFRELVMIRRKELNPDKIKSRLGSPAQSCWDLACPVLPDESIRPCRNLIKLALDFQKLFFNAGTGSASDETDQWINEKARSGAARQPSRRKHIFLAHRLIQDCLRKCLPEEQGLKDVFDEVDYFHSLGCVRAESEHYMGLFAFAKPCFIDFSGSGAANVLFFGCEPFLAARKARAGREEEFNPFAKKINAKDGGTIYVYQPKLGHGRDPLIARVLKAVFFETVLGDVRRQENGAGMPLVAYVADEFHRFITSDPVHGEQSFFDTCRSFGAFCVVATQSMSSLQHALGGDSYTNKDAKAVEILLNNTGTKLFFRTTDRALHETIERLCPLTPSLPKVTQVRPPSTLRPGECYAVVTDGRFLRGRIDLTARSRNVQAAGTRKARTASQ